MPGPFHLYLVRHAVAEERGPAWPDDSQRPLTEEGAKRWRRQAAGLAALEARPDLILTSPFTRARQTADLLAAALMVLLGITPDAAFQQLSEVRGLEVPETDEQRNWVEDFAEEIAMQSV